jgi:hypothetical protein
MSATVWERDWFTPKMKTVKRINVYFSPEVLIETENIISPTNKGTGSGNPSADKK